MAPGGEMLRLFERFGENVPRSGSHEWLPYSKKRSAFEMFKLPFSRAHVPCRSF